MRHLDLFSGIGGFALAAQRVWGDELDIVSFCEIDPFCQKVLKKHWPDVPICEDIRKLDYGWITANSNKMRKLQQEGLEQIERRRTGDSYCERCEDCSAGRISQCRDCGNNPKNRNNYGKITPPQIDILTGGFPCQPYSVAGNRKGNDDDRALWPEMLRVIREVRPRWIVGENVAGIIELALEQVCASLEMEGYEVQPVIIPACATNAPHRRDRVWILAHAVNDTMRGGRGQTGKTDSIQKLNRPSICTGKSGRTSEVSGNPVSMGLSGKPRRGARQESADGYSNASDPQRQGLERQIREGQLRGHEGRPAECNREWDKNWLEVATLLCGMDDGLPAELDGFKLSKSKHREQRLKSLGNAIVPQVAEVIFRAIKETEDRKHD
jgi:DNA (cytosine-5)-methyltransferase 1